MFAVDAKGLAGVTASEKAEQAWDGVEGASGWAPVATSYLFPVEGIVVIRGGCLCSGTSCAPWQGSWGRWCCEGRWWVVPSGERSGRSAGLVLLGETHVDVLWLAAGVAHSCWVYDPWAVGWGVVRLSRCANVKVVS